MPQLRKNLCQARYCVTFLAPKTIRQEKHININPFVQSALGRSLVFSLFYTVPGTNPFVPGTNGGRRAAEKSCVKSLCETHNDVSHRL